MAAAANIALEARDLHICLGRGTSSVVAVAGISFQVRRGEAYALIGESGCGKTTVLRSLSGLNEDYGGAVLFNGAEVPRRRDKTFFKNVQMVFQDPYASLHPRKTVQDALLEPLQIHALDCAHDRVGQVLNAVGLGPEFRFRYPHQLSGGQRQRVAIARCLAIEPMVLLLDEPTSALDVSVQAEILNLLQQLRAERYLTYLMVSHDLAVVAHMCSRVAVMNEGRIVEELESADLKAHRVKHPYTQALMQASLGYRGATAAGSKGRLQLALDQQALIS
jgi:peptide/nickel transport system ATP-binding protein